MSKFVIVLCVAIFASGTYSTATTLLEETKNWLDELLRDMTNNVVRISNVAQSFCHDINTIIIKEENKIPQMWNSVFKHNRAWARLIDSFPNRDLSNCYEAGQHLRVTALESEDNIRKCASQKTKKLNHYMMVMNETVSNTLSQINANASQRTNCNINKVGTNNSSSNISTIECLKTIGFKVIGIPTEKLFVMHQKLRYLNRTIGIRLSDCTKPFEDIYYNEAAVMLNKTHECILQNFRAKYGQSFDGSWLNDQFLLAYTELQLNS